VHQENVSSFSAGRGCAWSRLVPVLAKLGIVRGEGDGGSERMSLTPQPGKLLSATFPWLGGGSPRQAFTLLCRLFFCKISSSGHRD